MAVLHLLGTQISDIAPLAKLIHLERLVLSDNKFIQSLKGVIPLIENGLEVKTKDDCYWIGLFIEGCPITEPPQDVIKQGNTAILDYFKQTE